MPKELQSSLGTIAILCGGFAGALALLDWLVSKPAKDWLRNQATNIWYWLSYQRTWPYVRNLQKPRSFDVFFGLGFFLISSFVLVYAPLVTPPGSFTVSSWLIGFGGL